MPGFARGLRRRILTLSATRRFGERGGAFAPTERIAMTSYVFTHATVLDGTEGMEPQPNMTVVVTEGIIEKVGPAATAVAA